MGDSLSVMVDTLNANIVSPDTIHVRIIHSGLFTFEENPCALFMRGVESVGLYVILMAFLLLLLYKKGKILEYCGRYLTYAFLVVWLMGFVVYDIGLYSDHSHNVVDAFWSLLGVAPMAIIHAFEMFLFQSDVSAIHDGCFENSWFMFFYSITHFLAAFISLVFVIKHFGFNMVAAIKMFIAKSWFGKSKDTTYVFWGMNNATYHLARSINVHHHKKNDESYRIIIVRSNRDLNTSNSQNGLDRLFNFLSSKDKDIEKMREIEECLTINTFVSLPELDLSSLNNPPDILNALGLESVSRLIDKKTSGDIHMFFLSEDESANIKAVANLKKDCTILKRQGRDVIFYCHARHNSINRVIEDFDTANSIEVKIVDTSNLSIECLKRDVCLQPISFVDIDKTKNYGTVTSPFTSLIIGFGETGKDALRFLYEFGAFVDSDNSDGTHRSKFNCHIVDKQLNSIIGPFRNSSPQLFSNRNKSDGSPLVETHPIDYNSDEFYNELLCKLAPDLNYIVIAIGNDEAGMTLAVRILKYMRRQGRDFKKLRILVRSYESSLFLHMNEIAKHFNENEERITLFGNEEQLYTYSMIIEDEFDQHGKDYYEAYRSLNPEHDEDGSWEQRRKKLKGLIKLKMKQTDPNTGCPVFEETPIINPAPATLNNLQKLHRKETQDKANALHEATKMKVLEEIIPNWCNQLVPNIFEFINTGQHVIVRIKRKHQHKDNPKEVHYTDLDSKEQLMMDNLAKLEHLRWNASHEVLGYTPMPSSVPDNERGCDEARVTHNCLIDWEDLDNESDKIDYIRDYKIYDYGVVETTIDIYRRDKEKNSARI